jgi:hypothetical protein
MDSLEFCQTSKPEDWWAIRMKAKKLYAGGQWELFSWGP